MKRWRAFPVSPLAKLFLAVVALAALPVQADRTNHLFLDETQMLPEGDVELQQWLWSEGLIPSKPGLPVTTWLWFGPTVGISSHFELSLPLVVYATSEAMFLSSISLVARYRFLPREDNSPFQPLIRLEYQQPLSQYVIEYLPVVTTTSSGSYGSRTETSKTGAPLAFPNLPTLKALLVMTYGDLTGIRATANVGVQLGLPFLQSSASGPVSVLGAAGVGISVPLGHDFRVAAELDGQIPLASATSCGAQGGGPSPKPAYLVAPCYSEAPYPNVAQLYLGPSVAWTHGQIWVTFGSLFGLTRNSNRFLPKVLWGITF